MLADATLRVKDRVVEWQIDSSSTPQMNLTGGQLDHKNVEHPGLKDSKRDQGQ